MAINIHSLDMVVEKTIETVENSKYQIFEIAEQARAECHKLRQEIDVLRNEINEIIQKGDKLEQNLRRSKLKLSEVSRNFQRYSESDIRQAYEEANQLQIEHSLIQEKEKQLRHRRDDMQFRLRNLEKTVEKAEALTTQIGVVLDYLSGDIKQASQLIEDVNQQQQIGLKVIQAQEEERKRVAREIHDGPAQSLANVALRSELIEKILMQEEIEKARTELKELKIMLRDSVADVRRIIFDLRPMALDDLGLIPTLKKYIENVSNQSKIEIQLKTFGKEVRLPSLMEVAIFRLVQESLNNVVKHSKATECLLKVEFQKERIFVIITDNGVGFDMNQQSKDGFGLLGMKERMKLLEGDIVIHSSVGKGTKLLLTIPIKAG